MPKKILICIDDESVIEKLTKQAEGCGRSVTAQATHLVNTGAVTDRPIHLEVALKNISDRAVPCTGNKNFVVSGTFIRAARKLIVRK